MSAPPGGEIVVTITANNLGFAGTVEETLPAGFEYESSTLVNGDDLEVMTVGQIITFNVIDLNEDRDNQSVFTYTVTVSTEEGVYTFEGVTEDFGEDRSEIRGETDNRRPQRYQVLLRNVGGHG
jgi:archaellum component FlaF (FlaF/FlaG flagellin family)